jgi:hypothetical protein
VAGGWGGVACAHGRGDVVLREVLYDGRVCVVLDTGGCAGVTTLRLMQLWMQEIEVSAVLDGSQCKEK